MLHGRLLEPDTFESRFFAMPKVNRARKEGKQRYAECMVQAAGAPCTRGLEGAHRADHRQRDDPPQGARTAGQGEAEVALVWLDPDTGISARSRSTGGTTPARSPT